MPVPKPRYSTFEALNVAIALGLRALEEIRALASNPSREGQAGAKGCGIASAEMINGELTLTLDDGRKLNVGRVAGDDGRPGARGPVGRAGKDASPQEIGIEFGPAVNLSQDAMQRLREVNITINGRVLRLLSVE